MQNKNVLNLTPKKSGGDNSKFKNKKRIMILTN